MSLHDEIMRLEMQEDRYALPYANGYSDARDDAAELACKTDAEIERLARENARLTRENAVLRDLFGVSKALNLFEAGSPLRSTARMVTCLMELKDETLVTASQDPPDAR